MLDLEDVDLFLKVVELGSFSRASEETLVPKSSVKKRMDGLEREVGVPLLYRTARGARLTQAGEVLVRRGQALLQAQGELKKECARAMEARGDAVVRVAHYTDFIFPFIQYCCDLYVRLFPSASIKPVLTTFADAYSGVRAGRFDVAFCPRVNVLDSAGISSQTTFRTNMCALLAQSSELASEPAITREQLACVPVATHRNWYQADQVEPWSKHGDATFDVRPMAGGMEDIQSVCASGGVYLFPESDSFYVPYVSKPLADPLVMTGGVAYSLRPSPATIDFVNVVEEYVGSRRDPKTLMLRGDFTAREA